MEAADNEALHADILVLAAGEPRSIVTGSWGNGLEAWQHFKNRFDPETEMKQDGVGLRALNPKITDAKELLSALDSCEDERISLALCCAE